MALPAASAVAPLLVHSLACAAATPVAAAAPRSLCSIFSSYVCPQPCRVGKLVWGSCGPIPSPQPPRPWPLPFCLLLLSPLLLLLLPPPCRSGSAPSPVAASSGLVVSDSPAVASVPASAALSCPLHGWLSCFGLGQGWGGVKL